MTMVTTGPTWSRSGRSWVGHVLTDSGVCVAGENACLPEDMGRAPGSDDYLEALRDPSLPVHGHHKVRIGGVFDPEAFNVPRPTQSEPLGILNAPER